MKVFYLFILVVVPYLLAAQGQKGESIYKSFSLEAYEFSSVEKVEKFKSCIYEVNQNIRYTYTLRKEKIGHADPSPFIAVSCRWEEKFESSFNTILEIRYSTNGLKWSKYEELKEDNHFEGPKTSKVSQLSFIDKNYQYYQIRFLTNLEGTGNQLKSFKLNFFNPDKAPLQKFFGCYLPTTIRSGSMSDELMKLPIIPNNLTDFNWKKQLKLDYKGNDNSSIQQSQRSNINQSIEQDNSTQRPTACPCTLPGYTTRNQWNCPQGQGLVSGVGTSAAVTHLIVHHSAGANTAPDWNAVVLSIWNFHTGTNGYSDIGYNWLVAPNGQLYEGRGSNSLTQNVTGAHFCGTNANTMGVCMIGTYTATDITTAARSTLTKLLAWKCCQQNIPPNGTALHTSSNLTLNRISGHRDGCATDCPGTQFYGTLPALRNEVQSSIDTCGGVAPCTPSLKVAFTGCPGNTLTFTPNNIVNGGATPTYSWYLNNALAATGNSYVLSNATNGDKVYARMTSNAACANAVQVNSDTATISCIVTTSVVNIDGLEYCKITPNPNNGNFNVLMHLNKSTLVQYKLHDAGGKQVYQSNKERVIGNISKAFQLDRLSNGIYFLEILFDGKSAVYKVLIQGN